MPKRADIKKVLVIGSGPIIIGQAAEFDYAGTQACRVLREEGIEVVLVNSNPATIMTDREIADKVYIEPLTLDSVIEIIKKEKPDSMLATLGGQTGLNLAVELCESGALEKYNVELLGTTVESIRKSEDREEFKEMLESIGEPVISSVISNDVESALEFGRREGYPVIVRPAYTLGGTGGGIADDEQELKRIATDGIRASRVRQILVEKSVSGWKEIEYEVMRDHAGNSITVCNMENLDPVGVHTGDSIVVAPTQTLRDCEHQMLRTAALNIINALKIEGGCNCQFALDPYSLQYYVIEVNPRVSRSSALASKATGYPIAKVATRIALGYNLDEILNGVTGSTYACFEPTLDYLVVKFPRWPFDKFTRADNQIGTRMKATGEVMSIGVTFEAALLKALRSLEQGMFSLDGMYGDLSDYEIEERLYRINTDRLFVVAEALRRGIPQSMVCAITRIDPWFLSKIKNIVTTEQKIKHTKFADWTNENLQQVKNMGIADKAIARWQSVSEKQVRAKRIELGILPAYRMVDTCGAEFDAISPYYYSAYGKATESKEAGKKTVVVLGSGPIRIGQGVEFDYCSVHCVWALKQAGYETVIINNNPETVSTDFDTSDRLYFEPLTEEDVVNVLDIEKPIGVVCQFGGQTAIKLAKSVEGAGYKILGTELKDIDAAEDREQFEALMERLNIARPKGLTVFTSDEAADAAEKLGYPVLVRPSYVLGGQGMEIAYNEASIRDYMSIINLTEQEHPVLVDKYLLGREVEVDAICDGNQILVPGIMEHIERAGVHSGDSISVYPPQHLSKEFQNKVVEITKELAVNLNVKGLVNIQFIEHENNIYVIEVNPRSSRTIPYISKVTGIPVVELGVRASLGETIESFGFGTGLYKAPNIVAIKLPVFSFEKLPGVDVTLGPEMKSTGEVLAIARTESDALIKGFKAAGSTIPDNCGILITVAKHDREEALEIAKGFLKRGHTIFATPGTAKFLAINGVMCVAIPKLSITNDILSRILDGTIKAIIDTPTKGRSPIRDGFQIRRTAVECSIPCLTSLDTASAMLKSLSGVNADLSPLGLHEI